MIKKKIYYRKLIRLYLRGKRLEKKMKEYCGFELSCYNCGEKSSCNLKAKIDKYGKKLEKVYDKYEKIENADNSLQNKG